MVSLQIEDMTSFVNPQELFSIVYRYPFSRVIVYLKCCIILAHRGIIILVVGESEKLLVVKHVV